jgi:hypothetical protein
MNWARRLRWQVAVPVAALAALAAAALPAAAQAAGPPGPGAGPNVPAFRGIAGRTAGLAAPQQAPVPPLAGATPAVAVTGDPTDPVVFDYTGSDKHDYEAPLTAPASAQSLGGTLVGGPGLAFSPAPLGPELVGPFARGGDNALWGFTGTSWLSFGGGLTSRPGVAAGALSVAGGEALDLVVRGGDGAVWDMELTHTTASPWRSLGGRTLAGSGPAAVNVGGTLYVLAIGTDGSVFVRHSTDGAHWSGWQSLGGRASGDVGVATPAPGVGVVFVRSGNAVWYNEFAGTTAGVTPGWHSLGGSLSSGVGAGSVPAGSTSVLVLGADGHIWMRTGTWPALGAWTRLL